MAKIAVGICSSVSLYKSLELISLFKKGGYEVFPVMTENASKLVSPVLFAAVSGHQTVFGSAVTTEQRMRHIDLAQEAELLVVVPATANFIAKAAWGIADDLLSTLMLSVKAPVVVAPAMNPAMWDKESVKRNVETLKTRGVIVAEPQKGKVACGDEGYGRLSDVRYLFALSYMVLNGYYKTENRDSFENMHVAVTAGAAYEPLDPVRGLTNRSSGLMGRYLAFVFDLLGACVTYYSGREYQVFEKYAEDFTFDSDFLPDHITKRSFITTKDLQKQLLNDLSDFDIIVMAAAPVDFTPSSFQAQKIKKGVISDFKSGGVSLDFSLNPDILKSLSEKKSREGLNTFIAGFAAETDDHIKNGLKKLKKKGLDLIVINEAIHEAAHEVGNTSVGMGATSQKLITISRSDLEKAEKNGRHPSFNKGQVLKKMSKPEAAFFIAEEIHRLFHQTI